MSTTAGSAPDGGVEAPAGPPAKATPVRTHDLTRYEIPATIDVPRGFKAEMDITERGEKIFQIRRGRLRLEVARLYGLCDRADKEKTLGYLKYSSTKIDDIADGLVASGSKTSNAKVRFYVSACVKKGDGEDAQCYSQRLDTEADAAAAYDICKSLKYKQLPES
jgi:hypothetical protein